MFSDCAVAFLDVLGFKNLVGEAEASPAGFNRLLGLKTVLDAHVQFDGKTIAATVPQAVHPKYIFVSDTIIISAPLQHDKYNGLDIVVLKSIEVAQKVFELGHLIRGGISVGKVWHDQSNIIGSGYIDACATEKLAIHPCIMLSEAASEVWRQPGRAIPQLCLRSQKNEVVDVLDPNYLRTNAAGIPFEQYFLQLRAHIQQNLERLDLGSDPRCKWEWMAGFFNAALTRHSIGTRPFESLPIPAR